MPTINLHAAVLLICFSVKFSLINVVLVVVLSVLYCLTFFVVCMDCACAELAKVERFE